MAVVLGVLGSVLVSAVFLFPNQVLTVDSGPAKADVLVLLGGGLRERPERAVELFETGEAHLIICTGNGDIGANQAALTRASVPASAILLEPKSRTTRENAEFTVAILRAHHLKSAIIVTSWYHSRRALACFEHFAPDIKFYSRPSYWGYARTDPNRRRIHGSIKSEYYKTFGYWLCYGVCPIFFD